MTPEIKRKIAVRKFFAIPVTITVGTAGAIYAAYMALLSLDLGNAYNDSSVLTDYWLATVIGVTVSTFLAYTIKEMLKIRGHFRLGYILTAMACVTLVTSTISFAASSIFFYPIHSHDTRARSTYFEQDYRHARHLKTGDDWSDYRAGSDYLTAPIYQPRQLAANPR